MKTIEVEQRSEEWLEARQTVITGTRVKAIKRGEVSEKGIKEHYRAAKSLVDKIGSAIIGTDADELGIAIAKILEEKKNA